MLSAEKNRLLTQVGPGTPMGDLLRRYWHADRRRERARHQPDQADPADGRGPRALQGSRRHVRAGRPALPAPPRRPLLRLGRGDRHPLQLSRLADGRDRRAASSSPTRTPSIRAARAQERCCDQGLSGAGDAPACCGPIWGRSRRPSCRCGSRSPGRTAFARSCWPTCRAIGSSARRTRCDPVHFEWMHDNWSDAACSGETGAYARQASQAQVRGVRATASSTSACARARARSDRYWTVGRVALWPNGFYLGNHFEWRVPVDDENTLSAWRGSSCACRRAASLTCRTAVPTWMSPIKDDGRPLDLEPRHQPGHHRLGRAGRDRRPHQGESRRSSDIGIAMMRKRFFEELEAIARGQRAKGVIRDRQRGAAASSCRTWRDEAEHRGHHARGVRELSAAARRA